jgi:DNA end-binding protein Ku
MMSGVSHIAVLRVHRNGKALVLQTLVWASQVRAPEFEILAKPVTISPDEAKMARQLVESMLGDFDHSAFVDTYAEQVAALVADKAAGVVPSSASRDTEAEAEVGDLLARLTASVKAREQAKPQRRRNSAA